MRSHEKHCTLLNTSAHRKLQVFELVVVAAEICGHLMLLHQVGYGDRVGAARVVEPGGRPVVPPVGVHGVMPKQENLHKWATCT